MTKSNSVIHLSMYIATWVILAFLSTMKTDKDLLAVLTASASYDSNTHPSAKAIEVMFDLRLTKIVKLDIKEQQLQINARILMRWIDARLTWNSTEYRGTKRLVAPASFFWTPDILLYNTANEESVSSSDIYKANLQIDEAGKVTWMSPVTLRSSCDINVKWFPFDTQSCSLLFGSISMTRKKLTLTFYNKPKSITAFQDKFHYSSGVWKMITLTSHFRNESYSCCKDPFSLIEFKLHLKRLPMYYVLYLILPCLCLGLLSPCIFFVPPESGERIGFGITIVLSMSVYLLVISDKLPEKSNESPLIGVLYIELFFVMIGTLIAAIATTHMAYRTKAPPSKVRCFFCNLCRGFIERRKKIDACITEGNLEMTKMTEVEEMKKTRDHSNKITKHHKAAVQKVASCPCDDVKLLSYEEQEVRYQEQWKELAHSIDNVNFWIFLVLTIFLPLSTILFYLA